MSETCFHGAFVFLKALLFQPMFAYGCDRRAQQAAEWTGDQRNLFVKRVATILIDVTKDAVAMIIIINGSFGVGKTTIAKLLCRSLPGSIIYDPEWVGFVLKRLPNWIKMTGAGSGDFQDIALWRSTTIRGVKLCRFCATGPVIVPMAFSRRDFFDELIAGIKPHDSDIRVFCLKASLATIKKRLMERGTRIEGPGTEWSRAE